MIDDLHSVLSRTLGGNIEISASVTTPQGGVINIPPGYNAYNLTIPAQQTTQYTFTVPATGNISGQLTNADGTVINLGKD